MPTPRLGETFKRAAVRLATLAQGDVQAKAAPAALASAGVAGATTPGGLLTREDARRAIKDVIRVIERLEPSHPAPLLLKRAERLLGMGFFEIIKDMAPNALSDIERIAGTEASE